MVMGGHSCSKGRDFESCTFFHICICSKIRNVLEKTKINEKEAVVGPFKTKLSDQLAVVVTYLCQ